MMSIIKEVVEIKNQWFYNIVFILNRIRQILSFQILDRSSFDGLHVSQPKTDYHLSILSCYHYLLFASQSNREVLNTRFSHLKSFR